MSYCKVERGIHFFPGPKMTAMCLLFCLLVLWTRPAIAAGYTIHIDCGGTLNFTNEFNQTWVSDNYFTGGLSAQVSEPDIFTNIQEKTLRFFPISGGKKNCYIVNVPMGMYYVRMFFVYDNYDNKSHPPSFDVSIQGTVIFSWGPESWTDENTKTGAYSDLFSSIEDGSASICLYSIRTDSPVIGALELVQVDPDCYNGSLCQNIIMVNYGRFTGGNEAFGAGLSRQTDVTGRVWVMDTDYSLSVASKVVLSTNQSIKKADMAPDYFPTQLYQRAHSLSFQDILEFLFPIDPSLDYMIWFHFAEIDNMITGPDQRVFDIYVNDIVVFKNVDIFREVGSFASFDLHFRAQNLTNATLSIKLVPRLGIPLICGIENYALLPKDVATDPAEVLVMRALKVSLQVPERMGWNGDPCAPSNWDAWVGVICNLGPNKKQLVITHLDLSNQGLQGAIGPEIRGLTQLLSLNLSNNNLKRSIPLGLGGNILESLDLSFNELSGSIPSSLGSLSLKIVFLNDNQLEGRVPESLYSIGVTGGYVNLTANRALCGVPSLPTCSIFWKNLESNQLSAGAKVGIAFAVGTLLLMVCVVVYKFVQKRKRPEYTFDYTRELARVTSGSFKRTRPDDNQLARFPSFTRIPSIRLGYTNHS